jgi:hypothetical protein
MAECTVSCHPLKFRDNYGTVLVFNSNHMFDPVFFNFADFPSFFLIQSCPLSVFHEEDLMVLNED